jgi:hypothetical protein
MVGIFVDDAFQLPGVEVVGGVVFQVQDDAAAALGALDLTDIELAGAAAAPTHALAGRQAGAAAFNRDRVGDDEARVKANAELADQLRVAFLVAGELGDEVAGAALGNSAEVVDGFLLRQTDAVVGNRQGLGGFVKAHTDFEFGHVFVQRGVVQRLKTQLVASV